MIEINRFIFAPPNNQIDSCTHQYRANIRHKTGRPSMGAIRSQLSLTHFFSLRKYSTNYRTNENIAGI